MMLVLAKYIEIHVVDKMVTKNLEKKIHDFKVGKTYLRE